MYVEPDDATNLIYNGNICKKFSRKQRKLTSYAEKVFKWYVEKAYQILFQLKVKTKIWDYQKQWKYYENNCNYKNKALYATLQTVNPE